MKIYNSSTHKKEEFTPIAAPKVTFYVCGPTVYDEIHIGNARTFLAFDVIRRYLVFKGYDVVFAQNLTDVDDKIIMRAQEQGSDAASVAKTYAKAFIDQMDRFGVLAPTIRPRATQEIEAMIEMISGLIEKNHAYTATNGDVYFSVRSCETYGEISGRNVDELLVGARIEENADKQDPLDFALWKAAKPGEPAWESPWGQGRPGWHTECAAMVHKYLGTPIDIHGGGADLIFPHHENESAQARGCWSETLAHIWMHTGMLRVDGEKMSKSLGNFYTLREILDKYDPAAVRLLMLQTHYRSPMDFSFERMNGAVGTLARIKNTLSRVQEADDRLLDGESGANLKELSEKTTAQFIKAMDDDFNTAAALASLFNLVTEINVALDAAQDAIDKDAICSAATTLQRFLGVLGVAVDLSQEPLPQELVDVAHSLGLSQVQNPEQAATLLLEKRASARKEKNWDVADNIRDAVSALGLQIEDSPQGSKIVKANA